jgi:hypothetical protein
LAEKNDITTPRVVAEDNYTLPVAVLLANFLHKFTVAGVVVVPVCDGNIRQLAKQATNIWIAGQEKSCISALQLCSRIRGINDALSDNNSMDESSTAMMMKQLQTAEKK